MVFFWKKWLSKQIEKTPSLPPTKIEVFARYCVSSKISQHKKRLPGFTHEKCYQNLLATLDPNRVNLTFFLDVGKHSSEGHFMKGKAIEIAEGSETGSFLRILDYVMSLDLHPETILYFLEDDYLHRPGWVKVLIEGFSVPNAEYVTLFDHCDKYFFPSYAKLRSQIFVSDSCHWRTTPSTTQTFAVKMKTLKRDLEVHRRFSLGREITADHKKFCYLNKRGAMLISSIPGWSTHVEDLFASPTIDWSCFLTQGDSDVCQKSCSER